MPFNVGNAAAATSRVVVKFNDETLKLTYNKGERYASYRRAVERKESEMAELALEAEKAQRLADRGEDISAETIQKLQREAKRARRDLCDQICTVIESWDLTAPEEYDLTKIRENYLATLGDEEKKDLSKEDLKALKSLDGPGDVPVEGVWLNALPLADKFVLDIVTAINEDFASGGKGSKKP